MAPHMPKVISPPKEAGQAPPAGAEPAPRNHPDMDIRNEMEALRQLVYNGQAGVRRLARPTYQKPYPSYIDDLPFLRGFKVPSFSLFNGEDLYASALEHIGRMWPSVLANMRELLLREEIQRKNNSKPIYYKNPIHQIEVMSTLEGEVEEEDGPEVALAEIVHMKTPITCKAVVWPGKEQRNIHAPTGGFIPYKQKHKSYSFNLSKAENIFDELQRGKAIKLDDKHIFPKPEELKNKMFYRKAANETSRQQEADSTKLEERDKWRTRLKQPEPRAFPSYTQEATGCSRPSTTSNSTNVRPSGPVRPAMV
ncbi:unnamed protein product [Prunus brigantina]